jgi:hypothetical protein
MARDWRTVAPEAEAPPVAPAPSDAVTETHAVPEPQPESAPAPAEAPQHVTVRAITCTAYDGAVIYPGTVMLMPHASAAARVLAGEVLILPA